MNLKPASSAPDTAMNPAFSCPEPPSPPPRCDPAVRGVDSRANLRKAASPASAGRLLAALIGLGLFGLFAPHARAQWITQTNYLKPGWNGVYLHVNPHHDTLSAIAGLSGPIEEIWYWDVAKSRNRIIDSPQEGEVPSQWTIWYRTNGATDRMLTGNGAYLVRVSGTAPHVWRVTGKPVTPTYQWTLSGLNFIGFPTPPNAPPNFESFLQPAPELLVGSDRLFRYQGGELGPTNPVRIVRLLAPTIPVERDEAYWARAGTTYLQYFGPFRIEGTDTAGIQFGAKSGQARFRLRNQVTNDITVSLQLLTSEPHPSNGSTPTVPPLLLRGSINTATLTYSYTNLNTAPQRLTLTGKGQVGSEVEVVVGLNRSAMAGPPGTLFAGVLRLTDSLGFSQVDMAVSAERESTAGLWVGKASVSQVSHYLKNYAKATNAAEMTQVLARLQLEEGANGYHYRRDPNTGYLLAFGGPDQKKGAYVLDGPAKVDMGTVAAPFPLRLIVHNDGSLAQLLQKVYHGIGQASNLVLTTRENLLLPTRLAEARRIVAAHLPITGDSSWPLVGEMRPGQTMLATNRLAYDDHASNPFLHTYHPDHDNLNPAFNATLAGGLESYGVTRVIALTFTAPAGDDFNSLTQGSQAMAGDYDETITLHGLGSQTREYRVRGAFALKRISEIPSLTLQ